MQRALVLGLMAIALLALPAGCGARGARGAVQQSPRHLARYEQQLARVAARDSGCRGQQVQPYRIAETIWTANTCTGPYEYALQCQGRGRRARCSWARIASAPEAAAQYLACPPHTMQQQPGPSPTTRAVMGCGRQVLMGLACGPGGCGWMATAPPTQGGAPPPPPGYGAAAPPGYAASPPPGYGAATPPPSGGQVILVPAN